MMVCCGGRAALRGVVQGIAWRWGAVSKRKNVMNFPRNYLYYCTNNQYICTVNTSNLPIQSFYKLKCLQNEQQT